MTHRLTDLPPCSCGHTEGKPMASYAAAEGDNLVLAIVECSDCGKDREIRFRLTADGRQGWRAEDQKP